MQTVTGRDAIRRAYREPQRADDYINDRYVNDPLGRALHEHQVRLLGEIMPSLGVRRLLEVAPGPARLTVHVPPVETAYAVEQSPAMLEIARQRLEARGVSGWNLIEGDAFNLPAFEQPFDLVMTFKLVRHFDRADRAELYRNMRRVLRPGGYLLLDVANAPANRWLHTKWGLEKVWIDDFWFTPDDFRSEMRDSGFADVRLIPVQPALRIHYYLWNHLGRMSATAARVASRWLDRLSVGEPLEWMALCRCE